MTLTRTDSREKLVAASGGLEVEYPPLVAFIYHLMRDHVTPGVMEAVLLETPNALHRLCNGWLAQHAEHLVNQLTSPAFASPQERSTRFQVAFWDKVDVKDRRVEGPFSTVRFANNDLLGMRSGGGTFQPIARLQKENQWWIFNSNDDSYYDHVQIEEYVETKPIISGGASG